MAFIEAIPEDQAGEATAAWYAADREQRGYLPNYAKVLGRRPEAYAAWKQLGGAISGAMDPRRPELATVARPGCCAPATARWPTARSWPS